MKSNLRKGISVLLCLAMVFAMMPNFSWGGFNANAENLIGSEGKETVTKLADERRLKNEDLNGDPEPVVKDNATGTWADFVEADEGNQYNHADFSPFLDADGNWNDSKNATISTAKQLAGLMVIVNADADTTIKDSQDRQITIESTQMSFSGWTINLTDDIDLSAYEWVPIGKDEDHSFGAKVNGVTNTKSVVEIKGMKIGSKVSPKDYAFAGLIGYAGNGITISNVGIGENSEIYVQKKYIYDNYTYAGGLIGCAYSTVNLTNCYNTGTVSSYAYAGGLIGYTVSSQTPMANDNTNEFAVNINNCYNTGTVSGNCAYTGGLIGSADFTVNLTNCYNTGTVSSYSDAGGLIGHTFSGQTPMANDNTNESDVNINNCYNTGTVSSIIACAGGLIGYTVSSQTPTANDNTNEFAVNINNCYNTGTVSSSSIAYAGGLIGSADFTVGLTGCYYLGADEAVGNMEGIEDGMINLLEEAKTNLDLQGDSYTVTLPLNGKKNTSANTELRADNDENGKSQKLGADFSMVYYFVDSEDKEIVPTVNEDNRLAFKDDQSGEAEFKGFKIIQNALTENGYTGEKLFIYSVKSTNFSKNEYECNINNITLSKNGGSWVENHGLLRMFKKSGTLTLPTSEDITKGGYNFAGWYDNAEFTGNSITEISATDTGDKAYYAKFTKRYYSITIPKMENGSVKADKSEAVEGREVTLTVEPGEGYRLVESSLKANGIVATKKDDSENEYTFTMPAENVTVDAKFTKIYSITIPEMENGSVTADTSEAVKGTEVTLTVEPNEGYRLVESSLKANGIVATKKDDSENEYTFKMPAENVTVNAKFTKIYYSITTPEMENGSVTADTRKAVKGTEVTLTVEPNEGYRLVENSLKANGIVATKKDDSENEYTFKMPSSNVTVTGAFERDPNYHEIIIEPNEFVGIETSVPYAKPGETVEGRLYSDDDYMIDKVYVNNEEVKLNSDYKFTFTMPDEDAVIKVTMKNGWVRDSEKCEETGTPWWYYYKDGKKLTGWQEIEIQVEGRAEQVQRYYFDPDRENSAHTGWMKDENSNWYYFAVNHYRNNTLLETPEQGLAMMWTGWANDGGPDWYYLDAVKQDFASGRGMMRTGWIQDGGKEWYYFKSDDVYSPIYGSIVIGWGYIDGKWYYFTDNESENMRYYGRMQVNWQLIDGYWYYFYDDGAMASNTWIGNYFVDENGRWIS